MYYFAHLSLTKVRELALTIGRCGHEIRTISAGFAKIEHPEMQVLDNLSGQIEGISREIIAYLQNSWDFKPSISKAVRPAVLLRQILESCAENSAFPKEKREKAKELLNFQLFSLRNLDNMINEAIFEDSKRNFAGVATEAFEKNKSFSEISQSFASFEGNCSKFVQEKAVNLRDFSENNVILAKFVSNCAHEIQNLCAIYNHKTPENTFSNKIVNLAGQIEDRSRNIQEFLNNHRPEVAVNKKENAVGCYAKINGFCDNIHNLAKNIEDLAVEDGCPLKISDKELNELLTKIVNLEGFIKKNMGFGYVL